MSATNAPRKRKVTAPPERAGARVTLPIPAPVLARLSALAALRGMTRNAYMLTILSEAARALVLSDRSSPATVADRSDSPV